ncbi:MAG TPA: cupin domain-containing protein [Polyangia bacterium]|jgi:quercetin dioxygenase-like cupin family protein
MSQADEQGWDGPLTAEDPETGEALAAWARRAVAGRDLAEPSQGVRQRLLRTLDGVDRFSPFFAAVQGAFDLTETALRDLLARLESTTGWSFHGEARFFHFSPGPKLVGQEAGVVRMAPGVVFPRHLHRGGELTFVLDGLMNDRGRLHGPGSLVESEPGTAHDYRAAGVGRDLILLSRHGGIEFLA